MKLIECVGVYYYVCVYVCWKIRMHKCNIYMYIYMNVICVWSICIRNLEPRCFSGSEQEGESVTTNNKARVRLTYTFSSLSQWEICLASSSRALQGGISLLPGAPLTHMAGAVDLHDSFTPYLRPDWMTFPQMYPIQTFNGIRLC